MLSRKAYQAAQAQNTTNFFSGFFSSSSNVDAPVLRLALMVASAQNPEIELGRKLDSSRRMILHYWAKETNISITTIAIATPPRVLLYARISGGDVSPAGVSH